MIVITAWRLKPEKASCGVSTLVTPSATTTSSATKSAGKRLETNKTSAARRITTVMIRWLSIVTKIQCNSTCRSFQKISPVKVRSARKFLPFITEDREGDTATVWFASRERLREVDRLGRLDARRKRRFELIDDRFKDRRAVRNGQH